MKEKLQQRILFPFILFTVVITILLASWCSIFISKTFTEKNNENMHISLSCLDQIVKETIHINQILHNHVQSEAQFFTYAETLLIGDIQASDFQIHRDTSYLSLFDEVASLGTKSLLPLSYTKDGTQTLAIMHYFKHRSGPFVLEYDLNTTLKNLSHNENFSLGFILHNSKKRISNQNFTSIASQPLSESKKITLKQAFTRYLKNPSTAILTEKPLKISFMQSQIMPDLYYYIATPSSFYISTLIQIVSGIIGVILLSTFCIVSIYMLILKKMTTSIDILRSVSKKVAKGDFSQKVFIKSNDEIGELSQAFNKMVLQLKSSTDKITAQKKQSDAIISCIPEGIVVTDFKNNLLVANKRAEQLFDFEAEEALNQPLKQVIKDRIFIDHSKTLKKTNQFTSEFSLNKDKKEQIFVLTSTVVKNEEKKPIGIVYILRDITQERQINDLKEGFLRTVSHELRTPLTSVIGFMEVVAHSSKDTLNKELQHCLSTALSEARNLKSLINSLLELSHMQAGQTNVEFASINVYSLVETLKRSLAPLTKGKDLKIQNNIDDHNLSIMADESKFRRIFINLISNGIKFTESGHISISCEEKEDHLELAVTDTGIGISPENATVIFDQFRQVDFSSTRAYEGIGLGLSIVKELVELHQGDVRLDPDYHEGARFIFTIKKGLSAADAEEKREKTIAS